MIDNLRPLTQEQRQGARKNAREAIVRSIGPRPAREQFAHHTISKYPPSVTRLISILSFFYPPERHMFARLTAYCHQLKKPPLELAEGQVQAITVIPTRGYLYVNPKKTLLSILWHISGISRAHRRR